MRQADGIDYVAWFRANKELCKRAMKLEAPPIGRELITSTIYRKNRGICGFCLKTCDPRRFWHGECAITYMAAKGLTRHANYGDRPLIPRSVPRECVKCGEKVGLNIDHKMPLGLARLSDDWRVWVRAWNVTNLQWLCIKCHVEKTTQDRRDMSLVRNPPSCVSHTLF